MDSDIGDIYTRKRSTGADESHCQVHKKGPNNQLTYVGQTDCNNPANGQYTCTEVTLDQNEEYLAISFWVEANNQQHSSGTAEFSTSVMP